MSAATMNRKAVFAIAALVASAGAFAQGAARVQTATGVLSVERPGAAPTLLAVGSDVQPGDVLRTERDSTAALRFTDGTQVTVRPNSRIVLEGYEYDAEKPAADNFAMRLLKGGMRTVTGLLGKRKPESFAVRAATATVGIRGTDFVVRLCEEDCAGENNPAGPAVPAATGGEDSKIAREATAARDFALKSLRSTLPVTASALDDSQQFEGLQRTGLSNPGRRQDSGNFELAQVTEEDGRNATSPGVYVQVRDGEVELKKDGALVVLQRGETGFTDTGSGALRKFTTPPPFLSRDAFLARVTPRGTGTGAGGRGGGGLMCGPAFGT